jgi:hypothetical protein
MHAPVFQVSREVLVVLYKSAAPLRQKLVPGTLLVEWELGGFLRTFFAHTIYS